jgi:16S rRNA processing protein RimM
LVEILRIVGAFGVRGAVRIVPFSKNLADYKKISDKDGNDFAFRILKFLGNGKAVIVLDGIDDRSQAEMLKGNIFYVKKSDLPKIQENEFYVRDLVGLDVSVIDSDARCKIVDVHNFGAGDLIELLHENKSFLVPFTRENFPDSQNSVDNQILLTKDAFDGFKN